MKNFLFCLSLEKGIYLNGIMLIFDLLGQIGIMITTGHFNWFEYYYGTFAFIKTIINILFFVILILGNNKTSRNNFYLATLFNTVSSGFYSIIIWLLLKFDIDTKYDHSTMNFFFIIFIFGYSYQIYFTKLSKCYYEEIKEMENKNKLE